MDISQSIVPNSEQVNAEDLISGPRTVTITGVEKGTKDQPVFIHLAEFEGRTFRPAKTVRRLLITAWGVEAATYTGRQLTLYNDPTVRWAGQEIGGVRISHMSHIDKPLSVLLSVSRGKREPFVVQPLDPPKPQVDESGRDWLKELADTDGDVTAIQALGNAAIQAHAKKATLTVIRSAYDVAKAAEGTQA